MLGLALEPPARDCATLVDCACAHLLLNDCQGHFGGISERVLKTIPFRHGLSSEGSLRLLTNCVSLRKSGARNEATFRVRRQETEF